MQPVTIAERMLAQVPSMRRFARALLQDSDAADKLVADALLKAMASGRFGPRMTVRAWLFAELFGVVLGRCGTAAHSHTDIAATGSLELEPSSPARADAGDVIAVERALAHLPLAERAIFLLVHLEDFSLAEAAVITGFAPTAVRARVVWSQATFARTSGMAALPS